MVSVRQESDYRPRTPEHVTMTHKIIPYNELSPYFRSLVLARQLGFEVNTRTVTMDNEKTTYATEVIGNTNHLNNLDGIILQWQTGWPLYFNLKHASEGLIPPKFRQEDKAKLGEENVEKIENLYRLKNHKLEPTGPPLTSLEMDALLFPQLAKSAQKYADIKPRRFSDPFPQSEVADTHHATKPPLIPLLSNQLYTISR